MLFFNKQICHGWYKTCMLDLSSVEELVLDNLMGSFPALQFYDTMKSASVHLQMGH